MNGPDNESEPTAEISISIVGRDHLGPVDSPRSAMYVDREAELEFYAGRTLIQEIETIGKGFELRVDRQSSRRAIQGRRNFDGGTTFTLTETLLALGGVGAIAGLLRAAQPMIVQWLKNRGGRGIKVKNGKSTIEVDTVEQLEAALKLLERHGASLPLQDLPPSPAALPAPTRRSIAGGVKKEAKAVPAKKKAAAKPKD